MKKSKNGFTLVELLAAIVILGILMIFAVPMITGMLGKSKDKIYIDDAKKLISQAEYQMRSSSNEIDVPDDGDCIVISLLYLDNDSFKNPPNNGEYLKENSFVVVKNDDGKLYYSAMIVEKVKGGGYKGVELTTSENLIKSDATKHVKTFTKDQLKIVKVDGDDVTNQVSESYINNEIRRTSNLGQNENYFSGSITGRYNYPSSYNDNISGGGNSTPKITLKVTPKEVFNSLEATLLLKLSDDDTPTKDLKIYVSYDAYKTGNFEKVNEGEDQFIKPLNFASMTDYVRADKITIYVHVEDPEGNYARKSYTYEVHKNTPPAIENSSISKLDTDAKNMTTALVSAYVTDDITPLSNIGVCVKESTTNSIQTCSDNEYVPYNQVFTSGNAFKYKFNCGSTCARDGSTHYLTLVFRDEFGDTMPTLLSYTFSNNENPSFDSNKFDIVSIDEPYTNGHSNVISVSFTAKDDMAVSNLTVKISDGYNESSYNYVEGSDYQFIIRNASGNTTGIYDGSKRNIKVTLVDSENGTKSLTKEYTLYKNHDPVIHSLIVDTRENPCPNVDRWTLAEDGGSLNAIAYINATDDMDVGDTTNLKVKYCRKADGVAENCTSYINYSESKNLDSSFFGTSNYDGKTYEITAVVKDSYGREVSKKTNYKVYKNKAPSIKEFYLESKDDGILSEGNLNTKLHVKADDDFDTSSTLRFTLKENGVVKIENAKLSDYQNAVDYRVEGTYDGLERTLELTVYDSGNLTDTSTIKYGVYKNDAPIVNISEINSDGNVCTNTRLCEENSGGNYDVKFSMMARDDIDNTANLKFCVSENKNSCEGESSISNYRTYSEYYNSSENEFKNIPFTLSHDNTNPYDGSNKVLYVYIMDSFLQYTSDSIEYVLYKNEPPVIKSDPTITSAANLYGVNLFDAVYKVEAEDDITSTNELKIKYCKKLNGSSSCTDYENYSSTKNLNSSFFGTDSYEGQTFEVYSVIKDKYGVEYTVDSVNYQVHEDFAPDIEDFDISYTQNSNSITVSYAFQVSDVLDTYSVCINDSESSCDASGYSGNYDGNSSNFHIIKKTYDSSSSLYQQVTSSGEGTVKMYIHIKDSKNKESHKDSVIKKYVECSKGDIASTEYTYTFNTSKTYADINGSTTTLITPSQNQKITMDRCAGKCYDHDNIFGYYDRKITYLDRFDSSKTCDNTTIATPTRVCDSSNNCIDAYLTIQYKATCSFKDCFLKNGSYETYAIGTQEYPLDAEDYWNETIDGVVYECTSYYKQYVSSNDSHSENITLREVVNEPICGAAIGKYAYNSSASRPYVRVDDTFVDEGD